MASLRGGESLGGRDALAIERLQELPLSERREGLEELVTAEFRTTLMMADDEDLPFDMSYFELGFTSLRIIEIKERLEMQLGRRISTNVLFNSPTVERLVSYLTDEVLADIFDAVTI
jgi:acyl carrier protein